MKKIKNNILYFIQKKVKLSQLIMLNIKLLLRYQLNGENELILFDLMNEKF